MKSMNPKMLWQCIYPILIHLGISFALGFGYSFLYMIVFILQNPEQRDMETVTNQVMDGYLNNGLYIMAVTAIITIPIFYFLWRGRRKRDGILWQREQRKGNWVLLVLMSACLCISFNSLIGYSGLEQFSKSYQQTAEILYSGGIFLELVVIGILAPVSEELMFRGMIFENLCHYMKPIAAGVISSLMFAIYHGNLVQGVYAFCIGCMLAFFCKRYGGILAPIVAHSTANVVSVCITEVDLIGNLFEDSIISIVLTILTTLIWIGGTAFLMKKSFK